VACIACRTPRTRRLPGADVADVEPVLGVPLPVALRQPPAASRDRPDAAPRAVDDLEDVVEHLDRDRVAVLGDDPRIGVLDLVASVLELVDRTADALQDVERLEPGHHDRYPEPLGQRGVLRGAHHGAHVTGGEERLHPAVR
jgi:hypothetical protein